MGPRRFELRTSRLSAERSNRAKLRALSLSALLSLINVILTEQYNFYLLDNDFIEEDSVIFVDGVPQSSEGKYLRVEDCKEWLFAHLLFHNR